MALIVLPLLGGCLGSPSITVPHLTHGTVAEYDFGGTPGGYAWSTGSAMRGSDGMPLFPVGGGTLVVRVVGPVQVVTPAGRIEDGSEIHVEYVGLDGNRTFVGKQAFVAGMGVVGSVSAGWQTVAGTEKSTWVHNWQMHGPDFLLATVVAGHEHRAGFLTVNHPAQDATERLEARVAAGGLELRKDWPGGGNLTIAYSSACPLPTRLHAWGPDQRLQTALRLRSCSRGPGEAVGAAPGSTAVSEDPPAVPLTPAARPWFFLDVLPGPDAASAWSILSASPQYRAVCPDGCAMLAAMRSEVTKDIPTVIPVVTERQHVHQWGFAVWDGDEGRRFVVEFRKDGPVIADLGHDAVEPPLSAFGIGDPATGATIGRFAARFGATMVEWRLEPADRNARFISMAAGEVDQMGQAPTVQALLVWMGPGGTLSSFAWHDTQL